MDIRVVIEVVVSLFSIILIGVIASKAKVITSELNKGLCNILLDITLPLMIVSAFIFDFDERMKANVIKSFVYSFIAVVISIGVSYVFLKPIKSKRKFMLQFANVFSNCGFIGFPLINSIYGSEGVIYASIFNLFFTAAVWTYGIILFTGSINKKDIKKVLLKPAIVAVYIGIIIMIFKIKVPEIILGTIKSVGSITSPLSMIIVGVILANVNIKKYLKDWTIYYSAFLRLIVMPLSIYFIFMLFGVNNVVSKTIVFLSAVPTATITTIFAESFDREAEYAAILVFSSALLSLITLPIIIYLIV